MKKKHRVLFSMIIFMLTFTLVNTQPINAETTNEKVYKIGVIEFAKYVELNEEGKAEGYFIDFFDLIAKELNIEHEYVFINNTDSIDKLVSGELDLCLGITITDARIEKVLFNTTPIALEKFALYTNQPINSKNLGELNGLKFGTIHNRATDWILDFFNASNIHVDVLYRDTYEEVNELLDNGTIDLVLDSAYKNTTYNKVYEFVGSQVFIAGNKNDQELMDQVDKIIYEEGKRIEILYNSYFDLEKLEKERLASIVGYLFDFILFLIIIRLIYPIVKKQFIRNKMRRLINANNFHVYYNPIYQSTSKKVIGFEGILKDTVKNKFIVNAKDLNREIKDNVIISEVCLWKLKKISIDYEEFKKIVKTDFYLALDMPIHLFENDQFVGRVINQFKESSLSKNSICIEFNGNIPPKNIAVINESINRLKKAGFIIAIDNFGIEYSNLNLIHELDLDIIKIDRSFTINLNKNIIKKEIIRFITRIGKAENKSVILEGIDQLEQDQTVEKLKDNLLYVQGSFYGTLFMVNEIEKLVHTFSD